jgi:hypothetical protein
MIFFPELFLTVGLLGTRSSLLVKVILNNHEKHLLIRSSNLCRFEKDKSAIQGIDYRCDVKVMISIK